MSATSWPPDKRAQLQQQFLGFVEILRLCGIGIEAEIVERDRDHLVRRIDDADAAVLEFLGDLGLEEHVEAIDRCLGQALVDQLGVVGNARRQPHVGNEILVLRVVLGDKLQQVLVEIAVVLERCDIDRLQCAGLDQALADRGAREGDVETAAAGKQPGFEHFKGIVEVHPSFNAGLRLEVRNGVFGEVVGEIVDEQLVLRLGGR